MARIRPATRLKAPKFSLAGTAALNGRDVVSRGSGVLSAAISTVLGSGRKESPGVVIGQQEVQFAEIPEIVFVEGRAETEELGIYVIDPQRRTNPGDLWWRTGGRLKDSTGADYYPRVSVSISPAEELPSGWTQPGANQVGVTFDSATGRLIYNGAAQPAAVNDWWVTLSTQWSTSVPFRIRVLRPTHVWGDNAATVNSTRGWGAVTQDATVAFDAWRSASGGVVNTAWGNATDSAPAVAFITPGTYTNFNPFLSNKRAIYLLGDPISRPTIRDENVTWNCTRTYTAPAVTWFWKNFDEWNYTHSCSTVAANDPTSRYRVYCQKVSNQKQTSLGLDTWAASNQEFDGTGAPSNPVIKGLRLFHFANEYIFDSGGSDLYHYHYLHGRPGGKGYFINVHLLGGHDCQQIKSTLPVLHVLNSYQSALAEPNNPAAINPDTGLVYKRANILIDPINVSDIQVYNGHFICAFNPNYVSTSNGLQSGAIYFRARRECFASDLPPYPQPWITQSKVTTSFTPQSFLDDAWNAGTTIISGGGYFVDDARLNGWPCTTATFKDPAFWSAVSSQAITDPANPYSFKHFVSYCTFEWKDEVGQARPAARNDGTAPRYVYNQGYTGSVFVRAPEGWTERSVDFYLNNTFTGFVSPTEANLFNYDDSEGTDTRISPNPMPGSIWPRSQASHFPSYSLVGGNSGVNGASVPEVSVPSWFKIGGTSEATAQQTVLSIAASSLTSGLSPPLAIPSLSIETARTNPEDLLAYPDTSSNKRTWHWQSKWTWDSVRRRMLAVHSPHIETDNLRAQLLSVYDEATNDLTVYENPIMKSVGHGFDTNGIDVAGRRLYKWTVPKYYTTQPTPPPAYAAPYDGITYPTSQYIQPQMCVLNLDATGYQDGAGLVKEIPRRSDQDNVTAPGLDFVPGVGVVMFHKNKVWILDTTTDTWSAPFTLSFPDGDSLHCIGHYNPTANLFIFGGGSYTPNGEFIKTFYKMDPTLPITSGSFTRLDDAPICMSVNNDAGALAKCCATYIPNDARSVFFHQDGNVYLLNPTASPGSQWTTVTGGMAGDPSNGGNDDRWCCSIPEYGVIAVGHFGFSGTSIIRLWKP